MPQQVTITKREPVLQGESSIKMTSPFGARMRQHREQQGLSLATIADRTKIKASLLEALERDDVSHWPPGIYRRAYVRAYAAAVGLDADVIAREFLDAYPAPVAIIEPPPPPSGFRGLVGSALGSLSRIRHTGLTPPATDRSSPAFPPQDTVPHHTPAQTVHQRVEGPLETVPTMGRMAPPDPIPAEANRPVDLLAAAQLCTELGRVETASQVQPLLREVATILDAKGLIVWVWDALTAQLQPVLVHGYSDQVVAQLPGVSRDDDNVTAAAFRSASTLAVSGTLRTSGALALPLMTATSCAGVLTIELPPGRDDSGSRRAVATFFAAMLAQLVGGSASAVSEPEEEPARASAAGS